MMDELRARKLWSYANGTAEAPEMDTKADDQVKATKEYKKELREHGENDDAAAALIRKHISAAQLHHVAQLTTANSTWTKICEAHEKQGINHALQWLNSIVGTALQEGGKVQPHINSIREAHDRMVACDVDMKFGDAVLAGILMKSFPPSYAPIKMNLSTLGKGDFTFAAVSHAMLNEEARRVNDPSPGNVGNDHSAMFANRQQQQSGTTSCNWCGLDRHVEQDCYSKRDGVPQRTPAEKQAARKQQRRNNARKGPRKSSPTNEANLAEQAEQQQQNLYHVLACPDEETAAAEPSAYRSEATVTATPSSTMDRPVGQSVSLHSKVPPVKSTDGIDWYVDSGASFHYCRHREWFTTFEPITGQVVALGDGRRVPLTGRGTISVNVPISDGAHTYGTFQNVQYVPDLTANLLSVAALTACGLTVNFHDKECAIRNQHGKVIGLATKAANKLFHLRVVKGPATALKATGKALAASQPRHDSLQLWHHRLGHVNYATVRQLFAEQMAADVASLSATHPIMPPAPGDPAPHCDACQLGKAHRLPFPHQSLTRGSAPLQLLHMDLCGPFRIPSSGGALYFMVIIDDYSRYIWLRLLKKKDEATQHIKDFKAWAETLHSGAGLRIKQVRFDGGGEFMSGELRSYLTSAGISIQVTVPDTPSQNGVAERANRTLVECMRSMMYAWPTPMPAQFWAEAVRTAAYLRNRCRTRAVEGKTPYEAWFGSKPTFGNLRVYGCLAYAHTPIAQRTQQGKLGKLEPKATRCVFIGYAEQHKAYRLWDTTTHKVIISRDVRFIEDQPGLTAEYIASNTDLQSGVIAALPNTWDILPAIPMPPESKVDAAAAAARGDHGNSAAAAAAAALPPLNNDLPPLIPAPPGVHIQPAAPSPVVPPAVDVRPTDSTPAPPLSSPASPVRLPRELRILQDSLPAGVKDHAPSTVQTPRLGLRVAAITEPEADPTTVKQALSRPDADQWRAAMKAEMDSLNTAGTYTIVPLPSGRHPIGSKWVFRTKRGADGQIIKHKARLVAQGFSQQFGIDYVETFAPVARYSSIRAILALVAHHDWELHQMDVRSAYLNGDLKEEIYMRQPEGFVSPGQESLVCRLQKSLYGLKQAGRTWNQRIDTELKAKSFIPIVADPCVYVYRRGSTIVIISLYVDDLLLCSDSLAQLERVKAELSASFQMEDLGEAHFVLGIEITRDRKARTLTISQSAYVTDVIKRFDMADCHPTSTPMDPGAHLLKAADSDVLDAVGVKQYQSAVGALMYAAQGTRPDIAYAMTVLSQFNSAPSAEHWKAVKRVMRYLRGTTHYGITYRGLDSSMEEPTLHGYCDSNYAEDLNDRKSVTGYAFLLSGAAVSWQAKKQPSVATSTTEAEYMAASEAAKEAIWWRSFMVSLGYDVTAATRIQSDNQSSIKLSKNPEHHKRSKHIDVRHHFIREKVNEGTIDLMYVNTSEMAADILTKPLVKVKHDAGVTLLGMHTLPAPSSSTSVHAA
jgi:transposase InsO family protein